MIELPELSPDDRSRFEGFINKSGPVVRAELGPCWDWTGSLNSCGYGNFRLGRVVSAHRVAWRLWRSDPGICSVLHQCDRPSCVNPGHLFLGSQRDNMRDCVTKGRMPRAGKFNGRAKLAPESVTEIRRRYAAGARQVDLAAAFGVTQTQISNIVRGVQWAV